jgi:hypothetical protein
MMLHGLKDLTVYFTAGQVCESDVDGGTCYNRSARVDCSGKFLTYFEVIYPSHARTKSVIFVTFRDFDSYTNLSNENKIASLWNEMCMITQTKRSLNK